MDHSVKKQKRKKRAKSPAVTCRLAVKTDVPVIFSLLEGMHGEFDEMLPPINPEKLYRAIEESVNVCVIIAENKGKIVGSIGLYVMEWWFSDSKSLADNWTYVAPGSRRSKAATLMVRKAKEFSDRAGVPLMMGVFSPIQTDKKNTFYRRHFKPMGEMFVYNMGE